MAHPLLFHNIDLSIQVHVALHVTSPKRSNGLHIDSGLFRLILLNHLKRVSIQSARNWNSYIILQRVRVRESFSSQ